VESKLVEPDDDPKLRELLQEWQVSNAPPSLDARVLGARERWWSFLLTGSIRVPVPVAVAIATILLAMAGALLRPQPAAPAVPSISLVDFRPVGDLNVRVIRGSHE
jgi:hypothetical protein